MSHTHADLNPTSTGSVLLGQVFGGFGGFLAPNPNDGSEDANSLLAFLHAAAKLVPRIHPGHTRVADDFCFEISKMLPKAYRWNLPIAVR
jgi:hypothetical protein